MPPAIFQINLNPPAGGQPTQSGIPFGPAPVAPGILAAGMEDLNAHLRRMQGMQEHFAGTPADIKVQRDFKEEMIARKRRLEEMQARFELDSPAMEVSRALQEEEMLRKRRLEVLKERFVQESAATEAARQWQEEKLLSDRRLEVLRERNRIDGLAAEEAKRQLAMEKEQKEFALKVNAERRKQDPDAARTEDLGALGKLFGQAGASKLGGGLDKAGGLMEAFSSEGLSAAMSGGMAGMAGPIGMALEVAMEGQAMLASGMRSAGKAVELFGSQLSSVVRDDHLGGFMERMSAVGDSMKDVPLFGETIAAANDAIMAVPRAFAQVQEEFVQLGQRVQQFSASLTMAQANVELRTLRGDIREAESLGPTLARLTEAQNATTQELRAMSEPLKKAGAELVTIPTEMAARTAMRLNDLLSEWGIVQFLNSNVDEIARWLRQVMGLKALEDDQTLDQLFAKAFVNVVQGRGGRAGVAGQGEANDRMRPPIINGGF